MEEPFVSVTPQGEAFSLCVGALPARTSSVDLIDEATNEPVVTWDSNFVDKQGKRFVCAQAIQADIESLAQEPDRYSLRAQVGSDTESFPLVTASTSGADPELTVTTTPGSPYYVEFKPDK